jgi:nucleoside-diphosphate-sugar epimerase
MAVKVLVTGAGGFIGHHLAAYLVNKGYWVRGVDLKFPEFGKTPAQDFRRLDLRRPEDARAATSGMDEVYHLAADMGGIGFITADHALLARNNTLIDINTLDAAFQNGVQRFLYSSSACVYPQHLQKSPDVTPLAEHTAWPADPEAGYGLEKLYTEKMCQYYFEDLGLETRVVRFHNVYGPMGTWDGGREKAPAAMCRKVARASNPGEIEIWGDGLQTRSYMYIDDCVEGVHRLMRSDFRQPLNMGTEEMVSVDELADLVAGLAGKKISKRHNCSKPQGVRGRNSDNSLLRRTLGWEPETPLQRGLAVTYRWIEKEVAKRDDTEAQVANAA